MTRKIQNNITRSIPILCGILLAGVVAPSNADTAQAATPKAGTYRVTHMTHEEHNSYVGPTKIRTIYTFKIHSYKNGKAKLSFSKDSCWRANTLCMKTKTVAVNSGKSTFSFKYGDGIGYPIHGKAWVIYGANSIKLKLKTIDSPEVVSLRLGNHAMLDTDGYITIRKGSHKEYIVKWHPQLDTESRPGSESLPSIRAA